MDDGKSNGSGLSDLITAAVGGLPAVVSKSVVGAIHRLVAGSIDVPATWLAGYKEQAEDRNYEKRLVRRGLADAALKIAAEDPELVRRTLDRIISESSRKQLNREQVARLALEEAVAEPRQTVPNDVPEIDEDWMARFVGYAENVSNEDAQRLWARVLVKESASPGTFSGAALRTISELDRGKAARFQRVSELSFGNVIPRSLIGTSGPVFSDVRLLIDDGLISGSEGSQFAKPLTTSERRVDEGSLIGRGFFLQVFGPSASSLSFNAVFLSDAGIQLARLLNPVGEREVAERIALEFPHDGIEGIILWELYPNTTKVIPPGVVLRSQGTEAEFRQAINRRASEIIAARQAGR